MIYAPQNGSKSSCEVSENEEIAITLSVEKVDYVIILKSICLYTS